MSDRSDQALGAIIYDTDFLVWTEQQARAIAEGRWADVDAANVSDEIASLGRELVREAGERTEILLSYLLKWRHLAEYRGRAWIENISRQREEIANLIGENPSLRSEQTNLVADGYDDARRRLRYETYFFETDFPPSCPFTVEQVFHEDYFPEELDAPAIEAFPTASKIA